ncbi:MAG: hypothetical protein ACW99F_15680 [Candidatus Hodarchaeales archaeon]|jgi:hypothetical protein
MELEVREFPLHTQLRKWKEDDIQDTFDGTFLNIHHLEKWLLENGNPFDYGYLIKASQVIYTPDIQEYLIRYKMQKEYNIFSYSQNFDEIPADYIEMLTWIDQCMNEALQEKQRLNDARR